MAEIIFRDLCEKGGRKDITVSSAGTHAQAGECMTEMAIAALHEIGIVPSGPPRPSVRFAVNMFDEYDHIVCMTAMHKWTVDPQSRYPHVYALDEDVPDPWCRPQFIYDAVCKQLQTALTALYNKICKT
jgi:protein-tyrosine-phosphatase